MVSKFVASLSPSLTPSSSQLVFALVKQLHRANVEHGDLEPRNVVRTSGEEGLLLIDFSESVSHTCPESDRLDVSLLPSLPGPTDICTGT
jgi:tRNA A-37 threonylcarbamoyl transferase component Bud32